MNDKRRKVIASAKELLEQATSLLETCKDEEQEAFDSLDEATN